MPALHNHDGSVSLELYDHGVSPSVMLLKREFTKDEWNLLTAEAREAGTTVFELLRKQLATVKAV